jgi:hypothetical protein
MVGVNTSARTRYSGSDRQCAYGVSDSTNDAPDKRALSLAFGPGMVVIGYECKFETAVLGSASQAHQFGRRELLTPELVTELDSVILRHYATVRNSFLRC